MNSKIEHSILKNSSNLISYEIVYTEFEFIQRFENKIKGNGRKH